MSAKVMLFVFSAKNNCFLGKSLKFCPKYLANLGQRYKHFF